MLLLLLPLVVRASIPDRYQHQTGTFLSILDEELLGLGTDIRTECTNSNTEWCCDQMIRPMLVDLIEEITGQAQSRHILEIESNVTDDDPVLGAELRDIGHAAGLKGKVPSDSLDAVVGKRLTFNCRIALDIIHDPTGQIGRHVEVALDSDDEVIAGQRERATVFQVVQRLIPFQMLCIIPKPRIHFQPVDRRRTGHLDMTATCSTSHVTQRVPANSHPVNFCLDSASDSDSPPGSPRYKVIFDLSSVNDNVD